MLKNPNHKTQLLRVVLWSSCFLMGLHNVGLPRMRWSTDTILSLLCDGGRSLGRAAFYTVDAQINFLMLSGLEFCISTENLCKGLRWFKTSLLRKMVVLSKASWQTPGNGSRMSLCLGTNTSWTAKCSHVEASPATCPRGIFKYMGVSNQQLRVLILFILL